MQMVMFLFRQRAALKMEGLKSMNAEGRLQSLLAKHKNLHDRIEALEAERAPDKFVVELKKEKLMVKDELEKLTKV
jgi:uncharacterized protein YdcH (DUF465 family)